MPITDRRTARRFLMRVPLSVRIDQTAGTHELRTQSEDVSSRGVYFYLSKDVKKGSEVEIVMTLPHEITMAGPVRVRCMGRVHRTERRGEEKVGIAAAIERYEFLREDAVAREIS